MLSPSRRLPCRPAARSRTDFSRAPARLARRYAASIAAWAPRTPGGGGATGRVAAFLTAEGPSRRIRCTADPAVVAPRLEAWRAAARDAS